MVSVSSPRAVSVGWGSWQPGRSGFGGWLGRSADGEQVPEELKGSRDRRQHLGDVMISKLRVHPRACVCACVTVLHGRYTADAGLRGSGSLLCRK